MPTLRKVAADANVSIGTVSKVLNGKDQRVDPEAKARILSSIRKLGYRPPAFEQNQKASKTFNVGLLFPELGGRPIKDHPYVREILDGVLHGATQQGWSLSIFAETSWDNVGNVIRRKFDGKCDGLIAVAPQPDSPFIESLIIRGTPLVQIGSTAWLEGVASVDVDNFEVGRMVGRHFLDLGHRKVAYVGSPLNQLSDQERRSGFLEVVGDCGIKLVEQDPPAFASYLVGLGEERPTALMAWHDGIADRLRPALIEAGFSIPEDISIVGVDDITEYRDEHTGLTTILNPLYEIGRKAVELIVGKVDSPDFGPPVETVPATWVMRGSTAPPKSELTFGKICL